MKTFRHLALAVFFVGIAALEIAHGLFRLQSLREAEQAKGFEAIEREFAELGRSLRQFLLHGREHAAYLARAPGVLGVLAGGEGGQEARRQLEAQLFLYLLSFSGIDRVSLLDPTGRERFRCEHIGNGVGSLPEALLDPVPARELVDLSRELPPGAIALSELVNDARRVEVPENERQVLHYVTGIEGKGSRAGILVLTAYAAPLLGAVRQFAPVPGVSAFLVDGAGAYLASAERERERGGARPGSIRADWPEAAGELLAGRGSVARGDTVFLALAASEKPPWRLVARIPNSALEAASRHLQSEYAWVIGTVAAITLILGLGGVFLVRMSMREVRLHAAQRKLEMERQLQVSERLGALGLLTAGVAHEINNPLEGIGNYLALLEREGLPEDKRRRYLHLVRHGLSRIRDIVRDLSVSARPRASSGAADVAAAVKHALRMVRYTQELKEVEVELRGLDAPVLIPGDQGRLEQIFINLLHNAGRAMAAKGKVQVKASRIETRDGAEPQVEVVVEDTGPGIPEEVLSRIFDPFFTTTEGTGLGLFISYGIARAHGGSLMAANRPGGGARFTLRLPAGAQSSGGAPAGAFPAGSSTPAAPHSGPPPAAAPGGGGAALAERKQGVP